MSVPGAREGAMVVGGTKVRPGVWMAAWFAYAAGVTGLLANLLLLAFFAFGFSGTGGGAWFGPANDLVGSLADAFMVPVVLVLSAWLPDRRLGRISRVVGLSALAVLTVGGPLLVLRVLSFEVQAPIMVAAWSILCLWLFLANRWLRSSGVIATGLARFGEYVGVGTVGGIAVFGLGVSLPAMSWAQIVLLGLGGALAVIGMFGISIWFVLLGRYLAP